jgi:hypothetical protein
VDLQQHPRLQRCRCAGCAQVYWAGAHHARQRALIAEAPGQDPGTPRPASHRAAEGASTRVRASRAG